jgi:hypothetical protein
MGWHLREGKRFRRLEPGEKPPKGRILYARTPGVSPPHFQKMTVEVEDYE